MWQGQDLTPNTLISDGQRTFILHLTELWTNRFPQTRRINHIRFQGDHNNNKMEMMNGEIRVREKTMRNLRKVDTHILKGLQIYHNYMRPHESLYVLPKRLSLRLMILFSVTIFI